MQDFQQKYASKYTSNFSSEPSSRPSYIPQTTIINNHSYPVYYNSQYGGYGYMNGGIWTAYSVVRDAVMLNALMGNHGYYYGDGGYGGYGNGGYGNGGPYNAGYNNGPYYGGGYGHSSGGFFTGVLCIIFLIFIASLIRRAMF